MEDLLEHNSDLSAKLMQIGDSIVYKLVQWTKRLPFYLELPVEVSPVYYRNILSSNEQCWEKPFYGLNSMVDVYTDSRKFINFNK